MKPFWTKKPAPSVSEVDPWLEWPEEGANRGGLLTLGFLLDWLDQADEGQVAAVTAVAEERQDRLVRSALYISGRRAQPPPEMFKVPFPDWPGTGLQGAYSTPSHHSLAEHLPKQLLDPAETTWTCLLERDPSNISALLNLGILSTGRGNIEQARDLLGRALAVANGPEVRRHRVPNRLYREDIEARLATLDDRKSST